MTEETNYTIEKRKDRLAIHKDGKCKAHGLLDERSALHAIWVVEGKKRQTISILMKTIRCGYAQKKNNKKHEKRPLDSEYVNILIKRSKQ